ncbi:MAG: hypothetical protein ABL932_21700 [Terricaulis sp.]
MKITLQQLRAIWSGKSGLTLDAGDYQRIDASAAAVTKALATGAALTQVRRESRRRRCALER